MGFTGKLALIYLVLAIIIIVLFKTGRKKAGTACIILAVAGIVVLAILWLTSPM